ncbi:MAG: hypothetical protein C0594_06390, partial [Marinilabiliales bacterium]
MRRIIIVLGLFLIAVTPKAQEVYDIYTFQDIDIVFEESNWDEILDNLKLADSDEMLIGTVTINGVQFDS